MPDAHRYNVVIAGSGPAAIEAALVLRRLAGDLIETTILTPEEDFVHLPMTVLVPFARSGSERHPLAEFVADSGARRCDRGGSHRSIRRHGRSSPSDGETLAYDALLRRRRRACRSHRIRARSRSGVPARTSACTDSSKMSRTAT